MRTDAANAAGAPRPARPLAGGFWLNQPPGTVRYAAYTASNTLGSADLALGRVDAWAERARLARAGLAGWGWLEAGDLHGLSIGCVPHNTMGHWSTPGGQI